MIDRSAHEGYARLPEDLLQDLLTGSGDIARTVEDLLGPAIEHRDTLRQALLDAGMVRTVPAVDPCTVCGVDGGFAVERTAAVDIALAVAVGVEGLSDSTTAWEGPQYEWWCRPSKHDVEVERLARGVMVGQELAILASAPHELKILDGSHLTLVIQLNAALTTLSVDIRSEALRVWDRLSTASSLAYAAAESAVVAMPKFDSSRGIADELERLTGFDIPGDDKYLTGLLLEPGELTVPRQVPPEPWRMLHFDARTPAEEPLVAELEAAIEPLVLRAIDYVYYRPDESGPAFRLEVKRGLAEADLDRICSTISSQITGPFVREPYPQYLADVMAKSVGLGLSALQSAVQLSLSSRGHPDIAALLIHSYRSEGV